MSSGMWVDEKKLEQTNFSMKFILKKFHMKMSIFCYHDKIYNLRMKAGKKNEKKGI